MNTALVAKEIRALLPIWAACLVALAGSYIRHHGVLVDFAIGAYIIGPALLGAHAFGHEYSHRTMSIQLAQPIDRRRLFAAKWLVAAAMTAAVAALAWLSLAGDERGMWRLPQVQALPLLGGLLMAPWLAIRFRNTLASIAMTSSIFSIGLIGSTIVAWLTTSLRINEAQDRAVPIWALAMIAACAIAGVRGVVAFAQLEAGDDAPRSVLLPRLGARTGRRFRPVMALIGKELQLQQLTLTLAGIFAVATIVLAALQRLMPSLARAPFAPLAVIYCTLLSLVFGAMASAEERQLGVFEWQLLQPASRHLQWIVKVSVTLILAVLVAAVLPAAIVRLTVSPDETGMFTALVLPATFLAAAGLYLSTLTNSGAMAMVLALPAGVGLTLFMQFIEPPVWSLRPLAWAVIPLMIGFASFNQRADRRMSAAVWQIAVMAGALAATRLIL